MFYQNYIVDVRPKQLKLGQKVQKLVEEKKYDEVITALDKISVPDGYKLSIHVYDENNHDRFGEESYPVIITPTGETIRSNTDDFWKLLTAENSPEGAWQIIIFYNLWHYLPLFWHANYEKRTYLYNNKQMVDVINHRPEFGSTPVEKFNPTRHNVVPTIWDRGDSFVVSTYYWTDFGGLKFEMLKVKIKPRVHVLATPDRRSTLFRYNCGICF